MHVGSYFRSPSRVFRCKSPPIFTPHLRPCRQREVYKEPEIDRPALILEMLLHVTFLMLMTYACMSKRIIAEAFYLYQAP